MDEPHDGPQDGAEDAATADPPPATPPLDPATVAAALRHLLDLAEAGGRIEAARYHVVVVPDGGDPRVEAADDAAAAGAILRALAGTDVRAFAFYGRRCPTTRPPARFLLTHEGRIPLFDAVASEEIDETGSLARPGTVVVPAAAPPDTQAPAPGEESDDGEDDEDDEDDGDDGL